MSGQQYPKTCPACGAKDIQNTYTPNYCHTCWYEVGSNVDRHKHRIHEILKRVSL